MEKVVGFVGIATLAVAMWFGVMWGLWSLWSWAAPQVYADGPHNLVAPSFWLFAACWTLMVMIGRAFFGKREK
jgi:hypothetical protein